MRIKNIAVLVSGGGSNLQAVMDEIQRRKLPARVRVVISDRPGVFALERAAKAGVEGLCLDRKTHSVEALGEALIRLLGERDIDFVVLAGFLSILNDAFIGAYRNAILNIHPSLIPSFCGKGFYGRRVHQAALDYGVKVSGATVHFVDEGTDTGPVILQDCVPVLPDDTADTLAARVLTVEHRLLPEAVALMAYDRVQVQGRRVVILEEKEDC